MISLHQSRERSPHRDKLLCPCGWVFIQPRGSAEVRVASPRPRKSGDAPGRESERACVELGGHRGALVPKDTREGRC